MPEDLTYGDLPPNVQAYLSRPGVNKEKAIQWFSLGISEPQTYNQAKLLAEAVGNSPEQAKVVAGQWQFESGGGSHVGANHNYFGIKSHDKATRDKLSARGVAVTAGAETGTSEVVGGKKVKQQSSFLEFPTSFDAFQAHRVFLETNPRYEGALAAGTAADFAKGLEKAGYATAPNYGTTLYRDYVAPKEKNPLSGDTRPKSLGTTVSKIKLGTSEAGQTPEIVPALPTRPVELIETNTLGVRPEISTSPAQANYIPTNSAPVVIPASEAMQMSAPKGWFGSGKSTFNAMGGTMYGQGGGIHINPAHKGDFTAKANAAGMSVQAYASKVLNAPEGHYDPSTRQQANFAHNAAGWSHEMGGSLYATGGSLNNSGFHALPKEVQNKIRTNMNNKRFEAGGPMGQLTEFNSGGSHEESPLGGIPQGQSPDGGTNLVEQGETKLNSDNYIFSKTLKLDKETVQEFNLKPNFVGKDFAEASKIANRKDSRRENDTIETNAIQKDLDNLMNAQEAFKQKAVEKKLAEIQSLDPNAMAQIAQSYQPQGMPPQGAPQEGMPQGQPSPEDMAMMQQQGQGQPPMDPAMMQQMMAQQQGAPQMPMQYGGPMSYKCGGGMYDYGGHLMDNSYAVGGNMPGSNFSNFGNYPTNASANFGSNSNNTLPNPYTQNNGLNGSGNNGLNTQGFSSPGVADQDPNNSEGGMSTGQKAAIAGAAIQGGISAFNTSQQEGLSKYDKNQQYGKAIENTEQGVVGAINPVFGMIHKGVGMIMDPLTAKATKTDAEGNLINRQQAKNEAIGRAFADPMSMIPTMISTGFNRNKYADQIEADAKANIESQKSQEDAYNQQQLGIQQQQQNMINTAVQAGLAGTQKQDNPNSNFAKYGGHQFPALTPTYKDNAGPMGQGLNNLYAMGGMYEEPGDPPVTAASTTPAGMIKNPNYADQLKEYEGAIKFSTAENAANDYKLVDPSNPEYNNWITSPSGLSLDKLYESTGGMGMHPIYAKPLEYTPAPPSPSGSGAAGFTSANMGIAMPERGTTENGHPMVANRQYSQYLEEAANSPEALEKRDAVNAERAASIQRIANAGPQAQETNQERLARERAEYMAKNQGGNNFAMGGNMNHYFDGISGSSQMFTSDFPSMYQGNIGLTTGAIGNTNLPYMAPGSKSLNTPIEGFKTGQDALKSNYENREGPGAFLANMAPIAYNAYQGWIAKQMPLPENMAYHYDPYLQNINSQLRDADKMGAQAYASLRNMGNPGAIAANLGNVTHELALAKAKIREAKENADNLAKTEAAKYNNKGKVDASLAKWQLEAQMKNAKAEAQKEALTGIKDYTTMQTQNALASDYNAMAGEGNYTYENIPYLQGLQRTFAASQAARNKKKEDNKTV